MTKAPAVQADTPRVVKARMAKLAALRERGVAPYAYSYAVNKHAVPSVAAFKEQEAAAALQDGYGETGRWAGRLAGYRSHGRSTFADLEDHTGRIQIYFKRNVLGPDAYSVLDLLDLGDWIGVGGRVFRTRAGQETVLVDSFKLLAKSLRPLPFGKVEVDEAGQTQTYSGLANREARYRQRYADLAVNPEVREVFRTRARVISLTRRFLDKRGFLEVETPVLQPLYGGAAARPFVTRHFALDRRLYLRIADELYLKRLIVGGLDRVYEISKDFRNEGIDRFHNPEFTMLEFYQAFADYEEMMATVESLVAGLAKEIKGGLKGSYQGAEIDFAPPFRRVFFVDALHAALGLDPIHAPLEELRKRAKQAGADDIAGAGRGKLMDKLFGELVQPDLINPAFVVDYPKELSPLAKEKRGAPHLTERFELFIAGEEIANAFSELNDPIDQRERFEGQAALRKAGDEEAHVVDEDYIRAMEFGLPPAGGVGMGIDRLVMLLADQGSIRDVILFPTLRDAE